MNPVHHSPPRGSISISRSKTHIRSATTPAVVFRSGSPSCCKYVINRSGNPGTAVLNDLSDLLQKAVRDERGGHGANARDGDDQPPLSLDPLDVALGALENPARDADAVPDAVNDAVVPEIIEPGGPRRGDESEHIHLVFRNREGNLLPLFVHIGIQHHAAPKGGGRLQLSGIFLGGAEEHQRRNDRPPHLFPDAANLHRNHFARDITLHPVGRKQRFYFEYFVEKDFQPVPMYVSGAGCHVNVRTFPVFPRVRKQVFQSRSTRRIPC